MDKTFYEMIEEDEGFEESLYFIDGIPHIGYGFNLQALDIPKSVADLWLKEITMGVCAQLSKRESYKRLNYARRCVVLNIAFNCGVAGCFGFTRMWWALDKDDFEEAARQILDSKAARRLPNRYNRLAKIMESGEWS